MRGGLEIAPPPSGARVNWVKTVKTVLTSNVRCRRHKGQVTNISCAEQISECGDYEDIDFSVKKQVMWYRNSYLLFAL